MTFPRDDEGQWTFHYTGDDVSGDLVVTMGFFCNTSSDYDQSTNDDVSAAWEEVVAVTCDDSLTYTKLTTQINDSTNVLDFETISNTPGGLSGNNILPLNNAVVVKKLSGFAGRRRRGRLYLPGIPEDAVDDNGLVLGSFIATIVDAMETFRTTCATTVSPNCNCAILHRDISKPAKPAYELSSAPHTLISSFSVDPVVGSQRKRLPKPGA